MMLNGSWSDIVAALKFFWSHWLEEALKNWLPDPDLPPHERPMNATSTPVVTETAPQPKEPEKLMWDTPRHAWHAVRVMCDNAGLSFSQKNTLCACVWQESNFYNYINGKPVRGDNVQNGVVTSSDWGICQVNDHFWIGPGKFFPSVDYVMAHPEVVAHWMIDYMKANNHLNRWSSYSTGAYKKWIPLSSPMWRLAEK